MELAPFDLTVHIGSGKTGTTSLQAFLADNREELVRRGWLYPRTPGPARHVQFGMLMMPDNELTQYRAWKRSGETDPEAFRRRVRRRLLSEIGEAAVDNVLISDEGMFSSSPRRIAQVRRFADNRARSLRLVAYVRRQEDHLLSRYQQVVKMGNTARLTEWYAANGGRMYDYHAVLRRWRDGARADALVVRPFERAKFHQGSLYQDFVDAAGMGIRADQLVAPSDRNESLCAEAVELLRLINLFRIEEQGAEPWQITNAPLVRTLAMESGPTLSLPRSDLDAFMARWEEPNRRVAEEFLEEEDRPLFSSPSRKERVDVQRLDPARLDYYLPLLGLPEAEWAGIRRVAEREAAA
ncbi:hypothetical protein [Nocardioides sambongensis]|uniref:hypothetical protein n=1 Tax=Nocardioides sambongensis TaxID=2589074 RepID=UPI00112A0E1C|nr:hypothetical protein [Nocardioides sambongensis]